MKINEARIRAGKLRTELEKHNDLYYKQSSPAISDFEYDLMLHELETIEKLFPELRRADSPTMRVGSDILQEFVQASHDYPMLSLANTYSFAELAEFDARLRKAAKADFSYVCELKLDGASISLKYTDGRFVRALTRGDGEKGDDVSANILTIRSIPRRVSGDMVPSEFTIRGEIIFRRSDFRKLNEARVASGEQPFANPRNAASGTLKLLDSKTVSSRPLDCYLYYLLGESLPTDSHFSNMTLASGWGFQISDSMKRCADIEEVYEFIKTWETQREIIDYDIDGVVIKVDNLDFQRELGFTSRTPRWAVAYKYQSQQALTRLMSVTFQVGRTGAVTPVANLEPVLLAGTTVKRATLHNADQIMSLDLHYNDMVYIEKGGEIIPKIIAVEVSRRDKASDKVQFITNCPECGTTLVRSEGESAWYCQNSKSCPPQLKAKIEHFISRRAMDIDGLGEETVDLLFAEGMIRTPADLYSLDAARLASLDRMGEKSAQGIMNSIERSKSRPWNRVLFALGIRHVGETTARALSVRFRRIADLISAGPDELLTVPDIGPAIAASIRNYFTDKYNIEIIEQLLENGVIMESAALEADKQKKHLEGMTVVITGSFSKHERDEYKEMIISFGGKVSSSVSARTSLLVAGENPGQSKMESATTHKVRVMSEDDFLRLIGEL
jgi:DNA ligase (NAD+)